MNAQPGQGIEGVIDGHHYRVGSPVYVAALSGREAPELLANGATQVLLGDREGPLARFELRDELRDDADLAIRRLRELGLEVHAGLARTGVVGILHAAAPAGPGILLRADMDGELPERLAPIFRDRDDLSSASDLSQKLGHALEDSENLIVICSPAAAANCSSISSGGGHCRSTGRCSRSQSRNALVARTSSSL